MIFFKLLIVGKLFLIMLVDCILLYQVGRVEINGDILINSDCGE